MSATLLSNYVDLLRRATDRAFARDATSDRAMDLVRGLVCSLGRRTLSRGICALGEIDLDWSAYYKLFSRSDWNPDDLFRPVLETWFERHPEGPVIMAADDTKLRRTGAKIAAATWQRDPMSPAFHVNLIRAVRYFQVTLIFPHYREGDHSARSYPIRFVESPVVKRPGKRASPEAVAAAKEARKTLNMPHQGRATIERLRADVDAMGHPGRRILMATDGGLCNRAMFQEPIDRVDLISRCRKDARLCRRAPEVEGSRRFYDPATFTPESVRQDDAVAYRAIAVRYGAKERKVEFKEVSGVFWRNGARRRPLRLFVLRPQPYKTSPKGATHYRAPAYLLTTDLETDAAILIQAYFDRWQIEVNHREEKDSMGVGDAQVRSPKSVARQPAFVVAAYSLLLLASYVTYGPGRAESLPASPKWRGRSKRASILDLLSQLRLEIQQEATTASETECHDERGAGITTVPNDRPANPRDRLIHSAIASNVLAYAYT